MHQAIIRGEISPVLDRPPDRPPDPPRVCDDMASSISNGSENVILELRSRMCRVKIADETVSMEKEGAISYVCAHTTILRLLACGAMQEQRISMRIGLDLTQRLPTEAAAVHTVQRFPIVVDCVVDEWADPIPRLVQMFETEMVGPNIGSLMESLKTHDIDSACLACVHHFLAEHWNCN